jgi:type IV pilus assembly protein PilX
MSHSRLRRSRREHGMVLIITLLLLVVVTLLAIGMFHGLGLEERIAGNTMEKQRAEQSAVTAEQYAEQWLVSNVNTSAPVTCSSGGSAISSTSLICNNLLSQYVDAGTVATVPWTISGAAVGFSYNPNNDMTTSGSGGLSTYAGLPTFYISVLGQDAYNPQAYDYQIDAWSYAGTTSTVAVIESTYQIIFKDKAPGP